jgi:hypothetical protein
LEGGGRIAIQGWPEKNTRHCLKNELKSKITMGMGEAVEYMPSKCKVLNSIPHTAKNIF